MIYTPLISALERQMVLCEFKARLIYIVEFQATKGYTVKPCLNIPNQQKILTKISTAPEPKWKK